MERRIAAFIIAPMWHEFVEYALTKYHSDEFVPPAPEPNYDSLPPVLRGEWNTDPSQGVHEILHWVNKDNPRSGGGSGGDSQYNYWEYPLLLWTQSTSSAPFLPNPNAGNTSLGFAIASPNPNISLPFQPFETFVEYETALGVKNVSYYLNGSFVGASNQPPFTVMVQPQGHGSATLKAVAETNSGQQVQSEISISVQ
jgi:hypothetical protein